jgi:hypothetical protein
MNVFIVVLPVQADAKSAGRTFTSYEQTAVAGALMQFEALFMEFLIVPPRKIAANAIPVPTMARMRAYSAAEAPDSSLIILMKFDISSSFPRLPALWRGTRLCDLRKVADALRGRVEGDMQHQYPLGAVELPPKAARLGEGLRSR